MSPIVGPFCIKIIREEDVVTVSPLVAPLHLLLYLLLYLDTFSYCVSYRWPSLLYSATEEVFLLCHLYLPQFIKKSRDNIEKNDILPAPAASQALQNSGNTSTELANPLKKKSGKHAS